MSLRTRLVLGVLGLLSGGLFVALGATWAALHDSRQDLNHEVLAATARTVSAELASKPPGQRDLEASNGSGDLESAWRDLARRGDIPSFLQLRGADGRARDTVAEGAYPVLPDPVTPDPDRPYFTAAGSDDSRWLVHAVPLRDSGETLVVAMTSSASDELMSRTAAVALVSTSVSAVAVALLAILVVGRGLRPLETMARTAERIGAGDLGRRVAPGPPGTEVGRLADAFNTMLDQLQGAFAERSASEARLRRFVADAAHELRTPVATIRGHAELFRRGGSDRPGDHAKILRRVESEAVRLAGLVDELLLLARLDQGRPLDAAPVALHHLVSDAVTDAGARQPARSITLENRSVTVVGDEARLRQVLDNLLANVLAHTDVDCPASVAVRVEAGHAVVEVCDTGPGLDGEAQERVFDRFYRAAGATARAPGGSGLGLSIVEAVVRAHRGEVRVQSVPGSGTTVTVRLPLAPQGRAS